MGRLFSKIKSTVARTPVITVSIILPLVQPCTLSYTLPQLAPVKWALSGP